MKTLYKTVTPQRAIEIAKAQSERYGIKFDAYRIGDGFVIAPIVEPRRYQMSPELAERLLPFVPKWYEQGGSLVTLAERSGLSLTDTAAAMWTLAKQGTVIPEVNRLGSFQSIHFPQGVRR